MKHKFLIGVFVLIILIGGGILFFKHSTSGSASLFGTAVPYQACPASGYKYVTQWGGLGSGNGQLNRPYGMAFDGSGNIYVADYLNHRIQKFSPNGQYLSQFGSYGTGNGQLNMPEGILVDPSGNIYVVDYANDRIQKFSPNGQYLSQFGTTGSGNGQFYSPMGIAQDAQGNIYVVDQGNNRVQKFNSSGGYLSQFGTTGSGNGQFIGPWDIYIDSVGNIYVTEPDGTNGRVQKFTANGQYLDKITSAGPNQSMLPQGVTVYSNKLFISDSWGYHYARINIFTLGGQYVSQFGSYGTGNGQFDVPSKMIFDQLGNLYVMDSLNSRIQKFSPCKQITVAPNPQLPLKPDLIVDSFTWLPTAPKVRVITNPANEPSPNTNFQIKAVIKNTGAVDAVLPVGTQISFSKGGVIYGAQQLMNSVTIAAGQTYPVTIYQSTTPNILATAGTFNITVTVDDYAGGAPYSAPANRVVEMDETNNSLTKSLTIMP